MTPAPDAPTRETWLQHLTAELRPWFREVDLDVPAVRIGVGFTSKGARSNRIGECWVPAASADGISEVFIHPTLATGDVVAPVLLHELIHASLPPGSKHGPKFRKPAVALGLAGRMTATYPTDELTKRLRPVLDRVGPYPHAVFSPRSGITSTGPKQTTRMVKVECPTDGYLVRTTRRWLDLGAPICPLCNETLQEAS